MKEDRYIIVKTTFDEEENILESTTEIRRVSGHMALTVLVSALLKFCHEEEIDVDRVVEILKIGDIVTKD